MEREKKKAKLLEEKHRESLRSEFSRTYRKDPIILNLMENFNMTKKQKKKQPEENQTKDEKLIIRKRAEDDFKREIEKGKKE